MFNAALLLNLGIYKIYCDYLHIDIYSFLKSRYIGSN